MDRRSPCYSPPIESRQSPSYSPPRRYGGDRDSPYRRNRESISPYARRGGGDSPRRSSDTSPLRRSREKSSSSSPPRSSRFSESPRKGGRDYSSSRDYSPRRNGRSRSPHEKRNSEEKGASNFLSDDEESLTTLCCKHCDVKLHDSVSIKAHLNGKPHLMQLQRLRDNKLRVTTGYGLKARNQPDKLEYDSTYWERERGPKRLRPDQERWLDERRLDQIEPKFQMNKYDHGQYRFRQEQFHCDVCDVWVRSRDQMQAHKEGKNHKKKSEKVVRHHCKICLIDVTCKDTLENHMKGKDHIKRVQQLNEKKKNRGLHIDDEIEVDSADAEKDDDTKERVKGLEKQVKTLQAKVKELQDFRENCLKKHETKDFEELLQYKNWCIETHQRRNELKKPGLHCKQEGDSSPHEASSSLVGFQERQDDKRRPYYESTSDDELGKPGIKSERRSNEGGRGFVKSERKSRFDEGGWGSKKFERRPYEGGRGSVKSEHRSDGKDEYIETDINLKSEVKELEGGRGSVKSEHRSDGKDEYMETDINLKSEEKELENEYGERDVILVE